ncbi:SET6 [Candida oxycetoniae]|uniref:SET6 n=1 Tax=Candida oxycetoniae TaxID=497107 RepID=A0AAI9SVS7_9ASCO|nr:SET6 [Candida oxycetoniae]KAI3403852.2 SET6 [Candida oxycetoniae]
MSKMSMQNLDCAALDLKEIDISPFFIVGNTVYGGRGCFSTRPIPSGTQIHYCPTPIGFTISRLFKKEVCNWCFKYEHGRVMRTDKYYTLGLRKAKKEINYLVQGDDDIDEHARNSWKLADLWNDEIDSMKESKRIESLPCLDEIEYAEAIYVLQVLFNFYKTKSQLSHSPQLSNSENLELLLFSTLESNETEKYRKYPYLVQSYINIFKFIKLTCSKELQPFVNSKTVRDIIGKNLSNAFGIWSHAKSSSEDKELLGFAVYPSASFFNHSCEANIKKIRIKNDMKFVTLRDIGPGEELCIQMVFHL